MGLSGNLECENDIDVSSNRYCISLKTTLVRKDHLALIMIPLGMKVWIASGLLDCNLQFLLDLLH